MKRYEFFKKIVAIGDKSKYLFVKDFLRDENKLNYSIEELERNNIYLLYSKENRIKKDEDIKIYSRKFSKTKVIIIPKNILDISFELKNIDKLLVFNSFPYAKLDLLEDVDFILKEFEIKHVDSILYKEKRRFGITDISTENESLEMAKKIYEEKNIKTTIYNQYEENNDLFNIVPNFIDSFKYDYKNKYDKITQRFNDRYSREYDLKVKEYFNKFTLLDPEEFERFNNMFSYDRVKNSNDIWHTFVKNFEKEYMIGSMGILENVLNFYKEYVLDICFWNIDNDLDKLENTVINGYREYFRKEKKLKVPTNELEYIKLMNKKKENSLEILFKNKLMDFVDIKLKDIIKTYINNHYSKIEDMIGA